MKTAIKVFINIKSEQQWLAQQKGWKLVRTNGIYYVFEESAFEYAYEYICE